MVANKTFLVDPNSVFSVDSVAIHGAENILKTTNANALDFVKNENRLFEKIKLFSLVNPDKILMLEMTCSFATKPCNAETLEAQLISPMIG